MAEEATCSSSPISAITTKTVMISITYHIDVFNHSDENVLIGIWTIDGHLHHLRSCILRHYRQPKRLVIIRQMREEARVNGEDFETKEKTEC